MVNSVLETNEFRKEKVERNKNEKRKKKTII